MIPSLQRFYGGAPGDWLTLPLRWLRAYIDRLPVIQAAEQLAAVAVAVAADSNLDARKRQRLLDDWQRVAQAGPRKPQRKPQTAEEFAVMLATIGVVQA